MSNKFWKGMFFGALAGGALTLFNRETRIVMKENCQKASKLIKNPKETASKIWDTVESISEDISYITEKVEVLRETTPQVTKYFKKNKEEDIDQEEWEL
ncbi:MAG: YtxH domain-containing protein [Bacillota bacterium]|nr:YtxH domain-containing protein [Bacillota bacterium]